MTQVTAIIEFGLGVGAPDRLPAILDPVIDVLRRTPGVEELDLRIGERVAAIGFDPTRIGIGEIIRAIEDAGCPVTSVAMRRAVVAPAGPRATSAVG